MAYHAEGADNDLRRALHLGVMHRFRLEEIGSKQGLQHGFDLVSRVEVGFLQCIDGCQVSRLGLAPGWHGRLVGHEEVVHLPGDEPGSSRLLTDDIDDVFAVPGAGFTEKCLILVVVVRRIVAEFEWSPPVREDRDGGSQVPAGKSPCAGLHVVLGVIEFPVFAHPH